LYNIQPNSKIIGKNHVFVPTCHSTNDLAQEIIQINENFHGTVILADFQTGGRGQKGNAWESDSGKNLIFSVALDTSFLLATEQFYISMAMSLAVEATLRAFDIEDIKIKWPNDVFLKNKKTGGMLIENKLRGEYLRSSVVGIGLNVFQNEFSNKFATSLTLNSLSSKLSLKALTENLCEQIEKYFEYLQNKDFSFLHSQYLKTIFKMGQEHDFQVLDQIFSAQIFTIETEGKLVLKKESEFLKFEIKEIKYLF
jgi:BirA family transcriptional regulator, biotin operon repressor / biotin---[acetyl-CoA-carboxylase] ligase